MPDCPHPKCHEHFVTELKARPTWKEFNLLKDCASKKTPKSWLWIGFIVIGLPLLITGARVWSETRKGDIKYITRDDMEEHIEDIVTSKEAIKHMSKSLDNIHTEQKSNTKDIKEILRYMRNK